MSADKSQFDIGHQPPIGFQNTPGLQQNLPQEPVSENVPTEDGGFQIYKAADKLKGKKCIITGGDSGIGRATAILFAMEGAESLIAYLPEEEEDAQNTKKDVEKYGGKIHLLAVNLKAKENCKKVVDEALRLMGGINILFNNHAYQNVVHGITELSEEQWEHTFDTNIHRKTHLPNLYHTYCEISPLTSPSLLLPLQIYPPPPPQRRHHH